MLIFNITSMIKRNIFIQSTREERVVSFSIIIINFEYDKNSAKHKNITIPVSMITKFALKFVNTL